MLPELNLIFEKLGITKDDFDVFIETGSFCGLTINEMKNEFKEIVSIEITEKFSTYCKNMFSNNKNIEIIKGDSLIELPKLIDKYKDEKILFYLDAHYSAGETGKNEMDVPLIQELGIISNRLENPCLIIIDDADLFEFTDKYVSWEGINEKNILDSLGDRIKNYFYIENTVRGIGKTRLVVELNKMGI